jgi:hypothetical protein
VNADGCYPQPSILDKRPPGEIFVNFLSLGQRGLRADKVLASLSQLAGR